MEDSETTQTTHQIEPTETAKPRNFRRQPEIRKRLLVFAVTLAGAAAAISIGFFGLTYITTPLSIRQPLYEHYHFRLQILVDGKAENFAAAKYQEGYSKDNCTAAIPTHPIHLHDDKDQFVHIHWEGMTGGQVLKYYGWNYIGGRDGSMGYRFDSFPRLQNVPIHGNILPTVPDGDTFYVYSGDEHAYKQRSFDDFKSQDLEKFLGKVSNSPAHQLNKAKRKGLAGLFELLSPKAYAAASTSNQANLSPEELTRLNNLLGNVVIFVQKQKPSDAQIKDRFDHLLPLSDSACGG